jgi:hypothetical protein
MSIFEDDLSLKKVGTPLSISKERVRQIRNFNLNKIKNVLMEDDRFIEFNILLSKVIITESDLIEFFGKKHYLFNLLMKCFHFNGFELSHPKTMPFWILEGKHKDVLLNLQNFYKTINQKKYDNYNIQDFKMDIDLIYTAIKIHPFLIKTNDNQFYMEEQHIPNNDMMYKFLRECNTSRHYTEIMEFLFNNKRFLKKTNVTSILNYDKRFRPIGKTGRWGLVEWNHECTKTIMKLIDDYFKQKTFGSIDDIYEYIKIYKNDIRKNTIKTYIQSGKKQGFYISHNDGVYKKYSKVNNVLCDTA